MDQGPYRDSPLGYLIASGIFVATYRAVPVAFYLGVYTGSLKGLGQRFEPFGQASGPFDERIVRPFWHFKLPPIDDLVGEQERGEQELTRFAERAEAGQRFAAFGVDQCAGSTQSLFLAVAASDFVWASGDGEFDLRHLSTRLTDDVVKLGQGTNNLVAKAVVPAPVHGAAIHRPLDADEGTLGAIHGFFQWRIAHGCDGVAEWLVSARRAQG